MEAETELKWLHMHTQKPILHHTKGGVQLHRRANDEAFHQVILPLFI